MRVNVRILTLVVLALVFSCPVGAVPRPLPNLHEPAAERYRRLGNEALAGRDWRAARAAFTRSLELNPNLAGALIGLAEVAQSVGEGSDARSYLLEALSAHPDHPEVELAWGRHLFVVKRFDESEQVLRRALRHSSIQVRTHLALAHLYLLGREDPERASDSFQAVIGINPDHAGAHYGLGTTLLRLERFVEGERALKTAAKLSRRNPLPYNTLGNLYVFRGDHDKALNAFAQSIQVQPHYLPAYFRRGEIYFNQRKYARALTEYLAILKIDPDNAHAHLRCGFVYERQNKTQAATRAFLITLELDPKQSVAYNNLAWLAAFQKVNLDQALMWSQQSLKLSPDNPGFLDTLGWVRRARGELSQAARVLEKAVATSKSPPAEILYHLGVVYQEQGRRRAAAAYLERALEAETFFEHREDARERLEAVTTDAAHSTGVAAGGQPF